ncbi:MAG: DUF4350 domain-containing protein [Myxococcota bacterium]
MSRSQTRRSSELYASQPHRGLYEAQAYDPSISASNIYVSLLMMIGFSMMGPRPAAGQQDYDPQNTSWNGLAGLIGIAESIGRPIEVGAEIELAQLNPGDALFIVYPRDPLPATELAAFMHEGGRVLIADDFGRSAALLAQYHIERLGPPPSSAPKLLGSPHLSIAKPRVRHELSTGIHALASNHPTCVRHRELEAIFAFDDEGTFGLVLAGQVGTGRLAVLSDPSVLINNMLRFRDNQRFAKQLLRYISEAPSSRLYFALPDTKFIGRYQRAHSPKARLSSWFDRVAQTKLPPEAQRIAATVLLSIFILMAGTALPLRSPHEIRTSHPQSSRTHLQSALVPRVEQRDLLHVLRSYQIELETSIRKTLELPHETQGAALGGDLDRLREFGFDEQKVQATKSLLFTLSTLVPRQGEIPEQNPMKARDRAVRSTKISARKFKKMVCIAEDILKRLEEHDARAKNT